MPPSTQLTDAWQQWIHDNLARGCSPASLVESMVRENFEPVFAISTVYRLCGTSTTQVAAAPKTQAVKPGTYRYEPPRLPQNTSVVHTFDRDVQIAFRMTQPVVALVENLLSAGECEELIRLASVKLKRSTIIDPRTGHEAVITDRSSDGTFFTLNENDFITRLDRRIAEVMHWPAENGEGIQILHYKVGGEYKPHFDYFPPDDPGSRLHLTKAGQRVSTLVIYLNDVEAGGETVFPKLTLSVVPRKGCAIYFEYCNSLGQLDPLTLHGGCPVAAGEKWIATKWMRQHPYV